jgi:putative phage-type endonuclease
VRRVEIFECEQNTPEWYAARLGLVTASEFATVMAQGRGGGPSKTRHTYMLKLIGERMTGEPAYNYQNDHMERGKAMEVEARDLYQFLNDKDELRRVGFLKNGDIGCSPDSLIGNNGMLEIKTKLAHLQLEVLLDDVLPPEHMAQVQGQLLVAEREWCDFVSYWPKLPLFAKRVYRDEDYIDRLVEATRRFEDELEALMARVKVAA